MVERRRLVAILVLLSFIIGTAVPVLAQTSSQKTMLENLAGMKDFSTVVSAAKAAGLDSVLGGPAPYTLFAPSNAAFDKFPRESVSALLSDKAKLGDLLKYHVVPGKVTYTDLAKISEIKTVDGKTLPIGRQDGAITVGGAKVLNQGIDSSNGVIYQVDKVMTPPGFAMPQVVTAPALPLQWLGLLGAILLGGLAIYLLTRKRRYEEAMIRYKEPRARFEEKPKFEEAMQPEETMRKVRESVSAYREPMVADILKNLDLPLSGDALRGLNSLIDMGTFKDKPDFLGFLAKTYMQNDLGAAMSGGRELGMPTIMDIISKTGIARGFTEADTKRLLAPLLIAGFMAIYNYLSKRPAVKVA